MSYWYSLAMHISHMCALLLGLVEFRRPLDWLASSISQNTGLIFSVKNVWVVFHKWCKNVTCYSFGDQWWHSPLCFCILLWRVVSLITGSNPKFTLIIIPSFQAQYGVWFPTDKTAPVQVKIDLCSKLTALTDCSR